MEPPKNEEEEKKKTVNRQGKPLGAGTVSHAKRARRAAVAKAAAEAEGPALKKANMLKHECCCEISVK